MQQLEAPPTLHSSPTCPQADRVRASARAAQRSPAGLRADEQAARVALRAQVARLERRLSAVSAAAFPYGGIQTAVPSARGPRLLKLGELEIVRDALAGRLAAGTRVLEARGREQERARVRLERMLLAPGEHRRVRVAQDDLGEGGCGVWHVKPRLGLIGMLMGWWHVKLSSGCPLAT